VTVDHDSPDDLESEPPVDRSPFGSRRFARLVESPTARRLSPRRLLVASGLTALVAWGLSEAGGRLSRSVGHWVASQPEHQIPFSEIEMVPAPPPYVRLGASGLLNSVRLEAKYPETISTLGTDLEELRVAFSRNPWIEGAGLVRSSYRHLSIQIVYRRPMALVVIDNPTEKFQAVVVDRNGVEMPSIESQYVWLKKKPRYRLAGDSHPLIEIWGIGNPVPSRLGLVLRSTDPSVNPEKVPEAAKLAEFLAARADSNTPKGQPYPDFPRIHYHPSTSSFFLQDSKRNWVFWDSAPGEEATDEPKASEKWAMLGRFIDSQGFAELIRTENEYLLFTSTHAEVKRPSKEGSAQRRKPARASGG